MAAVTVNSYRSNVDGSYREGLYNITIANTGDTQATNFKTVKSAVSNDVAITKIAASGGTLTYTTTGAVTAALVRIIGL